jgi:hypothetical protein
MFLKRRLAPLAVVISALAIGAPASAATLPPGPVIGAYGCPLSITNPATGCGPYTPTTVLNALIYPPAAHGTTVQLVPVLQRLLGFVPGRRAGPRG